MLFIELMREIS